MSTALSEHAAAPADVSSPSSLRRSVAPSLSPSDPARVSNGVRVMPGNTPLSPSSLDPSVPPSLRVFVPSPDGDFDLPFAIGALEVRHDDERPEHDNYLCLDIIGPGMRSGLILVGTNDEQVGRNIVLAALAHYGEHVRRLGWDPATLAGVTDELLGQLERETYPRPRCTAEHESHPGRCGMGFQPVPSSLRASVPACLSHEQTATDGGSRDKDVADQARPPRPAPVPADPSVPSCLSASVPAVLLGPGGVFARPVHLSV